MIIANKKFEIEVIVRDTTTPEETSVHTSTPKKQLQDYSWEEISKINNPAEIFKVGDEKTITLKNGEELTIAIAGFNHDLDEKGNVLPITFTTVNLLANRYPMNNTDTNKSGWKGCKMRRETMAEIFTILPDDLQSYIKSTNKGETVDKLFLFNEVEIFGKTVYSDDEFGKQYDYYKVKHNRNKYLNDEDYSAWYWLRSPLRLSSSGFCVVSTFGSAYVSLASLSRGVAFGFCI